MKEESMADEARPEIVWKVEDDGPITRITIEISRRILAEKMLGEFMNAKFSAPQPPPKKRAKRKQASKPADLPGQTGFPFGHNEQPKPTQDPIPPIPAEKLIQLAPKTAVAVVTNPGETFKQAKERVKAEQAALAAGSAKP